jgi:hypothetical protein
MDYFFVNTDADSFRGKHNLNTWFKKNLAFTGGGFEFGQQLTKLKPGDYCLMYENRIGIVGVGCVLGAWDGEACDTPIYYISQDAITKDGIDEDGSEYRIAVDWFCDLRTSPIAVSEIKKRFGYAPRGAVKRIVKRRDEAEKVVAECQQ